MTRQIKICGITNEADARLAVRLGAQLLGFNFYEPSPRYIAPADAWAIIEALGADSATMVGVFVNASVEAVRQVLSACPLDAVQLHGQESPEQCAETARLGPEVIKAFRIGRPEDIDDVDRYAVAAVLLDAFREDLYGGTGHQFDWSWVTRAGQEKVFLAGGIGPDNIAEALAVGTYGVDLCSGVEARPGVKDADKMMELFSEIARYSHGSCS